MSSQLADVFQLSPGSQVVGLRLPDPPTPEPGCEVVRYAIEGAGKAVEFGTGLSEAFRAFVGCGASKHEFYAEATPVGIDPDDDPAMVRRCEWTQECGWGRWHRG